MSKTYKVTGSQPILDHEPGEEFTASIPREQEKFLIGIGGLEKVVADKPARPDPRTSPFKPAPSADSE